MGGVVEFLLWPGRRRVVEFCVRGRDPAPRLHSDATDSDSWRMNNDLRYMVGTWGGAPKSACEPPFADRRTLRRYGAGPFRRRTRLAGKKQLLHGRTRFAEGHDPPKDTLRRRTRFAEGHVPPKDAFRRRTRSAKDTFRRRNPSAKRSWSVSPTAHHLLRPRKKKLLRNRRGELLGLRIVSELHR